MAIVIIGLNVCFFEFFKIFFLVYLGIEIFDLVSKHFIDANMCVVALALATMTVRGANFRSCVMML